MNTTSAVAHIITADAVVPGDPEILIMTRDEGTGAQVIERFALGVEDLDEALDFLIQGTPWGYLGDQTTVQAGYVIVDVERCS